LLQRFSLMVWPDIQPHWKNVDEYPNSVAREATRKLFTDLSQLTEDKLLKLGALKGAYDKIPTFRLDDAALSEFLDYRTDLEGRLRSGNLSAAFEGHLAKYRKLIPALALINHLADGGKGDVSQAAVLKALAFGSYLESHAKRIYGASNTNEIAAATTILAHIRKGDLTDGFSVRDVHQKDWSNLTDRDHVKAGLDLLIDLDCIAAVTEPVGAFGGRPKVSYRINPKVRQ
jgi:hypothetical protein